MRGRLYAFTRDLHLYFGLFISPFILVFAISVFFLVHAWVPGLRTPAASRAVSGIEIPAGVELLSGREQVSALAGVFEQLGVRGEVSYIRRVTAEHRLVIPVTVPGREITVDLNLETHSATVTEKGASAASAMVFLHKMPGQHNASFRGNWIYMRVWKWLADATVYLVLFLTVSGIYLWAVLRAERRIGLALIGAGAFSFFGLVYALVR